MLTHFLLVRHGETEWNRARRIQGQTDVPLSALGEEQALRLGRRLACFPLHAAYASDLSRAVRTAEIVLNGRLPVQKAPALRERHFGEWEGAVWDDIQKRDPAGMERFYFDTFAPPGGERWDRLQDRVWREIQRIAARHAGKTVVLFTHGGPCKAALMAALGLPTERRRLLTTDNASLHRLSHDPTNPTPWKLIAANDTAHLEGFETTVCRNGENACTPATSSS